MGPSPAPGAQSQDAPSARGAARGSEGPLRVSPLIPATPVSPSPQLLPDPQRGPRGAAFSPDTAPRDRRTKRPAPLPTESPSRAPEEPPAPATPPRPVHLYTQSHEMLVATFKRQ